MLLYKKLLLMTFGTTLVLLLLLTAIEFSLGGSSPYTSTDKTSNIYNGNNTKTQSLQANAGTSLILLSPRLMLVLSNLSSPFSIFLEYLSDFAESLQANGGTSVILQSPFRLIFVLLFMS